MKNITKKVLGVTGFGALARVFLKQNSALRINGWIRSANEGSPVNKEGEPIPWMTYSAIDFMQGRLQGSMNVFEYGSGNSTLWFARHVSKVFSVEHDLRWYNIVRDRVPSNVNLVSRVCHANFPYPALAFDRSLEGYSQAYVSSIDDVKDRLDVVIIDGIFRNACAAHISQRVDKRTVVVFDNTDMAGAKLGVELLLAAGFRMIDFSGLAPITQVPSKTSVFYRPENCFDL